jgi:hypothetical protein
VRRGTLSQAQADAAIEWITTTPDRGTACCDADLISEAVPEDIGLKVHLFGRLDDLAPRRAILASNTAGPPITALAYATGRPAEWCARRQPVRGRQEVGVHDQLGQADRVEGRRDLRRDRLQHGQLSGREAPARRAGRRRAPAGARVPVRRAGDRGPQHRDEGVGRLHGGDSASLPWLLDGHGAAAPCTSPGGWSLLLASAAAARS